MKINVIAILINAILIGNVAHAKSYHFNPAFLDGDKGNVADLSWVSNNVELPEGEYTVHIYVNNSYGFDEKLTFHIVDTDQGKKLLPCVNTAQMEAMGINVATAERIGRKSDTRCTLIDALFPDAKTEFDSKTLSVHFSIPQRYMQNLPRGYVNQNSWEYGITSAWLNYVLNGSRSDYQGNGQHLRQERYFASLNSGINLGAWRLRGYTTWTHGAGYSSKLAHVRTLLQRDLPAIQSQLYLGETGTSASVFESVGLRGAQINTDDNMLPSSQRGYAPDVRGIARTNATVTLRQNGNIVYQTSVPAGEFILKDLYPTSSGGDLHVTIEEEDGHITQYVVPFASVPNLLRPGQLKYAVSAGRMRAEYRQDSPVFAQGELFYGWRYGLTFYGGVQLSERYRALALGAGQNMGRFGALSVDITHANSLLANQQEYSGESIRLRYSKMLNDYGTRFNFYSWRFSTSGFYSLRDSARRTMQGGSTDQVTAEDGTITSANVFNLYTARKARNQLLVSQNMGDYGTLSLSWDHQSYWQTTRTTESAMLSYNNTFASIAWGLGLQSSSQLNSSKRDTILSLSMSIPLGNPAWSTRARYAMTQANTSGMTHSAGLSGYVPGIDNANYSVMQRYSNQQQYGADMSMQYQGTRGNSTLGYSYSGQSHQLNYGISGGMVLHENGLTLSQPLGNTNILVKVPGASHVAVRNYKGIETDSRGYAVIPFATPYRVNRVELDVTTAGEYVEIENSVVHKTPTEGALVRATIPTRVGMKAMFFVTYKGNPLPFGTIASLSADMQNAGIIGDGGSLYLSGLPQQGQIIARWGNGEQESCLADYQLEARHLNPQTGLWTQELVCH